MTKNAIEVNGLSKVYQLGEHLDPRRTFRELLTDSVAAISRGSLRKQKPTAIDTPNEKWALTGVSFTAQPGEVIGLIGPNGAGKSTLLKIMSRITDPSLGKITLRGRVGSLLEVGSGFHPELTGRENIFLYGAILGMSRAEISTQFDEIVDYAGVEQSIDTPVKRYSSGMYVRLAFSVAAFLRTDILFVDEVLAVGDLSFQRRCLGTVKNIANSGRTVVFVSHNMSVIQNLCQRVLLIEDGKLSFDGSCDAGIKQYIHSQDTVQDKKGALSAQSNEDDDFRFMDIRLSAGKAAKVSSISTGDCVSIHLSYIKRQRCPGLEVALSVYDELGTAVCNFSSRFNPPHFDQSTDRPDSGTLDAGAPSRQRDSGQLDSGGDCIHHLTCTIDRLPLLPGRYRINIVARAGVETLQAVSDIISFDVISGDYFGTGFLPELGSVAVDHHWHDAS